MTSNRIKNTITAALTAFAITGILISYSNCARQDFTNKDGDGNESFTGSTGGKADAAGADQVLSAFNESRAAVTNLKYPACVGDQCYLTIIFDEHTKSNLGVTLLKESGDVICKKNDPKSCEKISFKKGEEIFIEGAGGSIHPYSWQIFFSPADRVDINFGGEGDWDLDFSAETSGNIKLSVLDDFGAGKTKTYSLVPIPGGNLDLQNTWYNNKSTCKCTSNGSECTSCSPDRCSTMSRNYCPVGLYSETPIKITGTPGNCLAICHGDPKNGCEDRVITKCFQNGSITLSRDQIDVNDYKLSASDIAKYNYTDLIVRAVIKTSPTQTETTPTEPPKVEEPVSGKSCELPTQILNAFCGPSGGNLNRIDGGSSVPAGYSCQVISTESSYSWLLGDVTAQCDGSTGKWALPAGYQPGQPTEYCSYLEYYNSQRLRADFPCGFPFVRVGTTCTYQGMKYLCGSNLQFQKQ